MPARPNATAVHAAVAFVAAVLIALPILVAPSAAAQGDGPRVVIVRPGNEETIHDNTGLVPVMIIVESGDAPTSGMTLRVLLDGIPTGSQQSPRSFTLQGVERGTHKLEAQLVDRAGNVVATSAPVTFHMWQASALFPGRLKTP